MTPEERAHRQQMIDYAKKKRCSACAGTGKVIEMSVEECGFCEDGWIQPKPLSPQELAEAIKDLKKKYPKDFPK